MIISSHLIADTGIAWVDTRRYPLTPTRGGCLQSRSQPNKGGLIVTTEVGHVNIVIIMGMQVCIKNGHVTIIKIIISSWKHHTHKRQYLWLNQVERYAESTIHHELASTAWQKLWVVVFQTGRINTCYPNIYTTQNKAPLGKKDLHKEALSYARDPLK